jgi:carboxyl-terminal processing protease
MDSKSSFMASYQKSIYLWIERKFEQRNEIIVNLTPMVLHFKRSKKGDQIISISNKKTLQVCNTLEAISNMILSDANKKIILT